MKKKLSPEDELVQTIAKIVDTIVEDHFRVLFDVLEARGMCKVEYDRRGHYLGVRTMHSVAYNLTPEMVVSIGQLLTTLAKNNGLSEISDEDIRELAENCPDRDFWLDYLKQKEDEGKIHPAD